MGGYPSFEKDEKMASPKHAPFLGYMEPGEEKKEAPAGEKIDASALDSFMAPAERERAATFYQQLQREREE